MFTVGYCFVVGDDAIFCTLNVIANSWIDPHFISLLMKDKRSMKVV